MVKIEVATKRYYFLFITFIFQIGNFKINTPAYPVLRVSCCARFKIQNIIYTSMYVLYLEIFSLGVC
jgi:hypothetical protein